MSTALRFLSPFVQPVGLVWVLLLATACICAARRRGLGTAAASAAFVALWLLGQPRLTSPIYRELEAPWIHHTVERAPNADAVIVLGGGWRFSLPDHRQIDLTEAADRLTTGVELCRLGKAPILVLGGDPVQSTSGYPEDSSRIRLLVRTWGLTEPEILTLGPVATTADEAERAGAMARQRGWKQVLLVTSAFHMRRATATFRKAGVEVQPVACDFRHAPSSSGPPAWRPVPDGEALSNFGVWWHEQLGWHAYRALGRL